MAIIEAILMFIRKHKKTQRLLVLSVD